MSHTFDRSVEHDTAKPTPAFALDGLKVEVLIPIGDYTIEGRPLITASV